jgi:hypothetical protein|tara:strand:+ start:14403 stop:14774 length:372 start_codon:yes stop_codon:yes gene_type:complete
MGTFYEWIGFAIVWSAAACAVIFALLFAYFRWFHGRFNTLGGKGKRQLSIASWHPTRAIFNGEPKPWQVDDYPFAWLRGFSYRMPWSGQSFVIVIGAVDKPRFQNLTGETHPRTTSQETDHAE